MEVERKETEKVTLEAGDIVEWTSANGEETITAVVAYITDDDTVHAIAITDDRGSLVGDTPYKTPHFVLFSLASNVKLVMKGSETYDKFDKLEIA